VIGSLADVTYWKLTVPTARCYSFEGTQRKSSTSLLDPDRTRSQLILLVWGIAVKGSLAPVTLRKHSARMAPKTP
jgi:hypothetical protein